MKNNHHQSLQASLLVALSAILYGFLGYLGTSVLQENFSISTMLFWRFFIAALWMSFFLFKKYLKQNSSNLLCNKNLYFSFMLGAIGYAGCGFYFVASRYMGTGLAMVLFFSYPVVVAFFSWAIYRSKLHIKTILALIAMVIGLFLLRDANSDQVSFVGLFFGLLTAVSYAFYMMGSKQILSVKVDSAVLTVMVCLGAASMFLLLSLIFHSFQFPHTLRSWGYLLVFGIFATALPIQLMLEGLKHISAMRASIISVLEPLVTVLLGIVLLHESISWWQMLGALIILTSALLVQLQKNL